SGAIERKLLPPRATAALEAFKQLIEDARAMLGGSFVERVSAEVEKPLTAEDAEALAEGAEENLDFNFGTQENLDPSTPPAAAGSTRDDNSAKEDAVEGFRAP